MIPEAAERALETEVARPSRWAQTLLGGRTLRSSESPATPDVRTPGPRAATLVPASDLVEVVGRLAASVMVDVLAASQRAGEPVAWVSADGTLPHPSDLRGAGIDIDALAVIRADSSRAARVVELLLTSGGYGAVALDGSPALPDKVVARLRAICRRHRTRLLVAPLGGTASLGATVSLRLRAERDARGVSLDWSKDKSGRAHPLPRPALALPPGATHRESPSLPPETSRVPLRIVS
tara:strand:- start:2342 stop:3052 length:711 start_codon:yes stop_codon:yes gene_type:complete